MKRAKDTVRELLDRLPDDCSVEDIIDGLYVMRSIERGLADVEAGRTIPHEQVEERMLERLGRIEAEGHPRG